MENLAPPNSNRAASQQQQQPLQNNTANINNTNQLEMGPQSQKRVSLEKRTHNMQSSNHGYQRKKKKIGDQRTLFGGTAFDSAAHCPVCRDKLIGRVSHKAHHARCPLNRKTRGATSKATVQSLQEEKRLLKHFSAPVQPHEKCSGAHITKENVENFFSRKKGSDSTSRTATEECPAEVIEPPPRTDVFTPEQFCNLVSKKVEDELFVKEHCNKKAPLAIIAAASVAVEQIIRPNNGSLVGAYFDGLTMTIPWVNNCNNPHYYSIMGQKLLNVDWKKMMGVEVLCPSCKGAVLRNDRTNFSKNKILHPIFGIDGPPQWCMIMAMQCPKCNLRFQSNDSSILCRVPAFAAYSYPVDSRYAGGHKNAHVARTATDAFDLLLPTHGNGDLCSRLLYNAINRAYLQTAAGYYATMSQKKGSTHNDSVNDTMTNSATTVLPFLEKDGDYMRYYPPTGDMIRDLYDEASNSSNNPWGISDHDRHTREIQGVKCNAIFAQDHTHQVAKNYVRKKELGVEALWDVATETGEIACAVLVPSTKTSDFSHAAKQLSLRESFNPKAMYSDTWPCKSDYWALLLGHEVKGRLGLFHFIKRISGTLRKKHLDYNKSVAALLHCLYYYNDSDYNNLILALKNGTLSSTGAKLTDEDIEELKGTRLFRVRYGKYLRKEIRSAEVIRHMLENWFNAYKCSSSDIYNRPAGGRLDPITQQPLFTPETRDNWMSCKDKAEYLQDPLPLDEMYYTIPPNPNSSHQLNEYLSRRGESSLESFHGILAHFANCGMRNSLADNLNLTGTARFNLGIRNKLRLLSTTTREQRKKMPGSWETVTPYFNHSELAWVNSLAKDCGITEKIPFQGTEELVNDTGERFFSEYMQWIRATKPTVNDFDMCQCKSCKTEQHVPVDDLITTYNSAGTVERAVQLETQSELTNAIQQPAVQMQLPPVAPPPMYMFFPPPPGWFMPTPNFQPLICCPRYQEYMRIPGRKGRPPHDHNCFRRYSTNTIVI